MGLGHLLAVPPANSLGAAFEVARSSANAAPAVVTRAPRWLALDLFRFLAVVLMVQGHTFNVLVEPSLRTVPWYRWHNYWHGYTAPMFMFAAGLAFGITTLRTWDAHKTPTRATAKRFERYVLIIAIGYLLHLPAFAIRTVETATPAQIRNLLKVDALQCIGVTLLVFELSVLLLRNRKKVAAFLGIGGGLVVLLAPMVHRLPIQDHLPAWFAGYFNVNTGSIFPLFPWAGFIAAGLLFAYFIQGHLTRKKGHLLTGRLAALGSGLLVLSLLLADAVPKENFGEHNFWKTNPNFFLWRVGILALVLSLFSAMGSWLTKHRSQHPEKGGLGLKTIQVLGQQTLVVYVVHLIILYGSPLHTGIRRTYGQVFEPQQAAFWFLVLFTAMAALAWGFSWLRKHRPKDYSFIRLMLLATVLVYVFAVG